MHVTQTKETTWQFERWNMRSDDGTHYISLEHWGGGGLYVDGSLHGRYDLVRYVKNGDGSFLNSGTGRFANCVVEVHPRSLNPSENGWFGVI